jgi:putative hydrolase of the HAD superfamily
MGEKLLPLAGSSGNLPEKWDDADEIEAVFLDAGNTVLFIDFEAVAAAVRETRVPIEASQIERAEYEARRRVDRAYQDGGFRDADMWLAYFGWMLGAAGVPEELHQGILARLRHEHRKHNLWRRTSVAVQAALARIKASGRKLAVISNSDGTCRAGLRDAGLLDFFDAVFDSHEVGIEKPDSGIFHLALGELSVEARRSLHMGDLLAIDVRGALRSGIIPVLVDPYPQPHELDCRVLTSVAELPAALGIR